MGHYFKRTCIIIKSILKLTTGYWYSFKSLVTDHETRQTVFNTDVDGIMDENEATPLLRHFHRVSARGVNSITIAIIAGLTLLFVTALGIGIYLLVVQNHSGEYFTILY